MSLFLIFWIRCHFLLYTKTKGDKDVMIKKITVKGNSVIVHISTKSKTEKSSHRKSSAATAPAMAHLPDCFRKAALTYSSVAASAEAQSTRSAKQASKCMQAPQALPTLRLRPCLQEPFPRSAKQPAIAITPIRIAAPTTAAPGINNAHPPGKCFNQLDAPVKRS